MNNRKRKAQKVLKDVSGQRINVSLYESFPGGYAIYSGEGDLWGYRVWYHVKVSPVRPPVVWVTMSYDPDSKEVISMCHNEGKCMDIPEDERTSRILQALL